MTTADAAPLPVRGSGCLPLLGAMLCALLLPGTALYGQIVEALNERSTVPANSMLVVGLALLLVLALLTRLSRNPVERAMLQCWLLALPLVPMMVPAMLIPPAEAQYAALARAAIAAGYVVLLALVLSRAWPAIRAPGRIGPVVVGSAAILAIPWVLWGALGSPLDVLLDVAAGLLLGVAVGLILSRVWLPVQATAFADATGVRMGGFVVGLVLLIFASNFGLNGGSLVLLAGLPPLGWPVMAIASPVMTRERGARAAGLLAGIGIALPLTFSDIDMLPLISLADGMETIAWSMLAAIVMGALGLLLALVLGAARDRGVPAPASSVGWGVAGGLWLIVAGLYFALGQPGFYGDRLFVVLREQADVSAAASIDDYDQRRRFVYETLTDHATKTQASLREALDRVGIRYTSYYLVNALEVQADTPVRLWLAHRPEVDRIMPSPVLRPLPQPLAPASGSLSRPRSIPWNLQAIEAPRAWNELGVRGQGIVIGQSDSGVEWEHPELRRGYRGVRADGAVTHDYNWLDPWHVSREPTDPGGHGTHTLGIVLGQTVGVAPDATWIACRNLLRNLGNPALYLDCLQFMLAPYPQDGDPFRDGDPTRSAQVLNNSWGCPTGNEGCDPRSLQPAVDALHAAGIFVVSSAGNSGPDCGSVADPIAIYADVLTVGAIGPDGRVADFSSIGPVTADGSGRIKPDLVAPGEQIISAYPGGTYRQADGTSQAGPHVAGVVALMWSANPRLIGRVDETSRLLLMAASPYGGEPPTDDFPFAFPSCGETVDLAKVPNVVAGYGFVNAHRAVQLAQGWSG